MAFVKPADIFDRDGEWAALSRFVADDRAGATLGVISGRRRQEKTFLLDALTATRWVDEPVNREPHKCAGFRWADPARPPSNTVPHAPALAVTRREAFSLDGW